MFKGSSRRGVSSPLGWFLAGYLWCSWAAGAEVRVLSEDIEEGHWILSRPEMEEVPPSPEGQGILPQAGKLSVPLRFPGWVDLVYKGEPSLVFRGGLTFQVALPPSAPEDVQVLVFLMDAEFDWYQFMDKAFLAPGENNERSFPLGKDVLGWEPSGHVKGWSDYHFGRTRALGIRLLSKRKFEGEAVVSRVAVHRASHLVCPTRIQNVLPDSPRAVQWEPWEITFQLSKSYENPFDPKEVSVLAHVTAPSQKILTIPAFFEQSFLRRFETGKEKVCPIGKTRWRVRFCPVEAGPHSLVIEVDDGGLVKSHPIPFEVDAAASPGFVRVASDNRNFEFDSDKPYYPVGFVIRSPGDHRMAYDYEFPVMNGYGTYAYDEYFRRMQEEQVNFCRVWMCSWWLALEWNANWPGFRGVGRYNLANAWRMDHLLDEALRRGVYIELTLTNHGQWSPKIDTEWDTNPYNQANGGPFERIDQFFYDEEARRLSGNRHRYSVSRWAAYRSLMGWAILSEAEWVAPYFAGLFGGKKGDPAIVADWHREMAQALRGWDPWVHPVTTHFAFPQRGEMTWVLPDIDFVQCNAYTGYDVLKAETAAQAFFNYYTNFMAKYEKPVLIGEYGGHWERNTPDELNVQLHTGCWAAFMSPMAGIGGYWWWPYIHAKNLYGHLRALVRFAEGEDRRGVDWQLIHPTVTSEGDALVCQALASPQRAYLWVAHRDALKTWQNIPQISGGSVALGGLAPGNYRVEFWDTYKGMAFAEEKLAAAEGTIQIPLPPVDKDLAMKVKHEDIQ